MYTVRSQYLKMWGFLIFSMTCIVSQYWLKQKMEAKKHL